VRAQAAIRRMAKTAEGPRLAGRARTLGRARIARLVVRAVELLALFGVAGALILAAQLANGPVYLDFLHNRIAASLQEWGGQRYTFELGPTYLMHDSWGVGLGFHHLAVRDSAGRTVLSAPGGKVGLNVLAILVGQVRVHRLELNRLGVRLRVAEDGALSIAVSGDAGGAPVSLPSGGEPSQSGVSNVATLVRAAAEAMAGASQAVDRLALTNSRFEIDNDATGASAAYEDFNLAFDRSGNEATARLSAKSPTGPWSIEARASVGSAPTLALSARDVSLADFAVFDKKPPPLSAEGPISFRLDARLNPDGTVQSLSGQFTLGAGKVRLNNPDALPFLLDEASAKVEWDDEAKELRFRDLNVFAGETHAIAEGWLKPPFSDADRWIGRLESRDMRFGPERPGADPVPLTSVAADFHFVPAESRFILDNVALRGPTVDAALQAEVAPDGPGVSLKLGLTANPSATADLMRLWPQFINPDLRDWCAQNLHGGQIQGQMAANWSAADLDAMAHKRALPRESLHGSFSAHDVAVDLMPGLPPMVAADGSGTFTGRDVVISSNRATMTLAPTRRIQGDNLSFAVPDTTPRAIVEAAARAHLTGTADALADLLARPPLRKQAALEIDPATAHGQAEGDLTLALKLGKTAKPEDTQFRATGSLTNLTLDKFIGEEKLEDAAFTVEAERDSLKMVGDGQLFGAATHIDASRAAGEVGSATLTLTLDPAARAKRGLNAAWLTGPIPVKLTAPLTRDTAEVEIDLAPVGIDNPVPGVVKAAGKPGKATFQIKPAPQGAALSNIAVDFGSVTLRGAADAAADGSIVAAKIAQARISAGDDFKIDVVNSGGSVKATVRGSTLDARPLIKSLTEAAQPARDFDIDAKLGQVLGADRQSITGFELMASRHGGDNRIELLRGRIGQGLVIAGGGAGDEIRLMATDAGALIRFAGLYSRMEGGVLEMSLRSDGEATAGAATVSSFVLRDEPAFRKLVAAGPAQADGVAVDPASIRFQKMSLAFERTPGVLEIKDAVIYNPYMGLTTEGRINFAHSDIDMSGAFVPAYSVNSLLNRIPLVGLLLGGGKNEGVFGVSYRVHGPLSGPQLTVNPLSAIAPGILRKMVAAIDGTAVQGDAAPAEPHAPIPVQR